MKLREQIDADLKAAMLAKNEVAKDALRVSKSELMLREVELGRPLTDEEVITALQKSIKSRRDAIDQFRQGNRMDAVQKEEEEIAVLTKYLPPTLGEAETRTAIQTLITELSLASKKDMGRLMKELKARHAGIDGKLASTIAGEFLKG